LKNVVIIAGLFDQGTSVAVVNRYRAMAKSLDYSGLIPVFISNHLPLDAGDRAKYLQLPRFGSGAVAQRLQSMLFEWHLHKVLKSFQFKGISVIIIPRNLATFRLLLLSRMLWRLPIVVDCMEWHESWQFKYGRFSPAYWRFLFSFHLVVPHLHGVLAISTYLTNHFRSRGIRALRLLPQIDMTEFPVHKIREEGGRVKLFYAGTPHKKDNIGLVLSVLFQLTKQEYKSILFTVAGISLPEIRRLAVEVGADWDSIAPGLRVLGRIPREQVLNELACMDFLILLRPVSRYSQAGFPSKVSESLAAGTPVITNLTSDLGEILVDGVNSIIAEGDDVKSVKTALRTALGIDHSKLMEMSMAAHETSLKHFDYKNSANSLKEFFD
jgi:glycosyltransferase involved in cell wall biosynthesis